MHVSVLRCLPAYRRRAWRKMPLAPHSPQRSLRPIVYPFPLFHHLASSSMTSTSPDRNSATLPTLSEQVKTSIPCDHVLLITLNRPKSLNAMTPQMEDDLRKLLNWSVVVVIMHVTNIAHTQLSSAIPPSLTNRRSRDLIQSLEKDFYACLGSANSLVAH